MSTNPPNDPGQPGRGEPDPFLSLRRGVDRLFDQVMGGLSGAPWGMPPPFTGPAGLSPRVDVSEGPAGLEIAAELPGIDPADVSIELEAGVLTLRAERKAERREEEGRRWHVVERQSGAWLRRFPLPFEAEAERIEARFDRGVLHVSIPRPSPRRGQATRIEIRGG